MSGDRMDFVYTISKEAFEMVKNGTAVLQSGGVRALDGSLIELAVPGSLQKVENGASQLTIPGGNIISGITMVSSIVGNIQAAFIQKGVNEANAKLDTLLDGQNKILCNLYDIKGIQKLNLALNLVTVGVSLEYFPKIEKQLNEISNTLNELKEHIEKQEIHRYIREYNKYCSYAHNFIERLSDRESVDPDKLSDIEAYMKSIILQFNNHDIDRTIGCNIIFGLVPLYIEAVKLYSSQYYWNHHKDPSVYERCLEVLESLNKTEFYSALKEYIMIDCEDLIMEDKYKSLSGVTSSVRNGINNFEFERHLWRALPQKIYNNIDNVVTSIIQTETAEIECDQNRVFIPIYSNIEKIHLPEER